ncbi:MAG TPA: hypothetical protein VLK65_22400 [Vicinamibacteria bacterium]|nr:hypothetical protein [Vicinamibacteria bacterium]
MRVIWFVLVGAALASLDARAATVVAMNLEQMTGRSDVIFVGRVTGQRADWNADRTALYTYTTFDVDRYLKGGSAARSMTIRLPGGQVGPFMVRMPGAPSFEPGEEVLLFCSGAGARIPTVLGLSLGKFTITADPSGEKIVKRDISGLVLANFRTDSRTPADPVNRYRLADIEARIAEFSR